MTETDSDIYRRLERLLPSVGMMVRRHFCILRYAFSSVTGYGTTDRIHSSLCDIGARRSRTFAESGVCL